MRADAYHRSHVTLQHGNVVKRIMTTLEVAALRRNPDGSMLLNVIVAF